MLYREGPAFPIVSPPVCLSNYLLGRHVLCGRNAGKLLMIFAFFFTDKLEEFVQITFELFENKLT
ncbi:hypothetical protein D7024_08305 [Desulfofundulus salinus]|uniref:Uncharacterized protein n=1 Tax=Desulfofundulus salinus TaxID=2419843 RepID=A0A494WU49_9FIRM|nr:hypothetical protein D7024_08305 [Desulfofundulus salinum]